MKYMLLMYMSPATWASLSEEQRNDVFRGHDHFQEITRASGEMVRTEALAEPSNSVTVRVRDGVQAITPGLNTKADQFFCGHYVVDCASQARAIELAALIPDAGYTSVEVRQIVHEAEPESQ